MAETLQLRRGTTVDHASFTGAEGEVTVDTTLKTLRVHDNTTVGGTVLAKANDMYYPNLFDFKWVDHLLNDASWIKADAFGWQPGNIYTAAYNHLLNELPEVTTYYFWVNLGHDERYGYTTSRTPEVGDTFYRDLEDLTDTGTITAYDSTEDGISVEYDGNNWTMVYSSETVEGLNQETIAGITITYRLAEDGHKICLPDQETNIETLYGATGVAWYYILDTVNQRFKLPRTKFAFTGYRDTVGNYIAPGLPNITGSVSAARQKYDAFPDVKTGAFAGSTINGQDSGFSGDRNNTGEVLINFDASSSSSIYGNSTTVQSPATQMYLYFYIGEFTSTSVVNIPDFSTVDVIIRSQFPTAANNYTWYRLYNSGWVEQGGYIPLGSSETVITIDLPIAMANSDEYNWNVGIDYNRSDLAINYRQASLFNRTSTTIDAVQDNIVIKSWQVSGMAAIQ